MSSPGSSAGGSSKRAKIWRRTVVGGGLALALTGLLWTVHATQSNTLVLALGAVFAGLCVYEGSHLPVFRGLHLQAPGWVAWFVAIACASAEPRELGFGAALVVLAGTYVALGLAAFDHRSLGRADRWFGATLLALAAYLVAIATSVALAQSGVSIELPGRRWELLWLCPPLALAIVLGDRRLALQRTAAWTCAWLVLPFSWLHHVAADWGVAGLVALVILSKIGDTAGYYAGSAFGKHHPFKTISPGKTTEGCLASLAAGVAAGVALVHFELLPREPYGLWGGAAVGALTNLAAQAGDLFESWVKRKAGVKDSGTWFGPSGGVLDLVDSFLFSIPAALVCWPMLLEVAPAAR